MRLTNSVLLAASLLSLAACDGGKDSDTGDTTTTPTGTTTTPPDTEITAWGITSAAGTTTVTVTAGADSATAIIDMIQTGDAAFSCGPDKELVCDVWQEKFSLGGSAGNFSTSLTVVSALDDQVNGTTTLFDEAAELNGLTVYIEVTDGSGAVVDCAVGGENPGYYSSMGCDTI